MNRKCFTGSLLWPWQPSLSLLIKKISVAFSKVMRAGYPYSNIGTEKKCEGRIPDRLRL
jgi:hypothetical protein